MRKKSIFIFSLFSASNAFASLIHVQGGTFLDGDISIHYPCGSGGEPLVIYSMPINNTAPISSLVPIYPSYVKNGYNADILTVDAGAQSTLTSRSDLIVADFNPGMSAVHFGLSRADQTPFYVNTINFAAIDATPTSHFVSSFNVKVNGATYVETVTPLRMPFFIEDQNFLILSAVQSIEGAQYSWDQSKPWQTYTNPTRYPIPYRFTPQAAPGSSTATYNGFGFWVCGQDNPNASAPAGLRAKAGQSAQDLLPAQ